MTPNDDKGYGVVKAIGGSDSQVEIHRSLCDGASLTDADSWDPLVDVVFFEARGLLHADDVRDDHVQHNVLESVRLSDVYRLLDGLTEALEAGARLGLLPGRLPREEWSARYRAAYAIRETLEGQTIPTPAPNDDDPDDDLAGDEWKGSAR